MKTINIINNIFSEDINSSSSASIITPINSLNNIIFIYRHNLRHNFITLGKNGDILDS